MADSSSVDVNVITTATDASGDTVISVVQSNVTESSRVDSTVTSSSDATVVAEVTSSSTADTTVVTGGIGADGADGYTPVKGVDYFDGADGADGADGVSPTITIGTTTTGIAGSSASVSNSGTTSAAILDFTIPRGNTGVAGTDGRDGTDGAAATISVGSTTTGSAGTSALVTNSGTTSAAVLDFTIPTGATGDAGPANSLSIGTVSEGAAAATITGTAPTQTLNLTLPKGNAGTDGADGAAATIAVGTVTTGAAGSSAVITNSGTSSAAVFDFTIPKGDTGAAGAGSGDMLAATYDPNAVAADAFNQDNMVDGTTNKNYTATEKTKLDGIATGAEVNTVDSVNTQTGAVVLDADDISDTSTTNKFVTSADITKLGNLSGTNTGDQTTITGNAGTATKLATARTIAGVSFDGSANIDIGIDGLSDVDTSTAAPTDTQVLAYNGTSSKWEPADAASGSGDVVGPASATDNAITVYDGTTGKLVKNSGVTISSTAPYNIGFLAQINGNDTANIVYLGDTQTLTYKDISSATNTFPTFNQNTTGSAATLTTGRTFQTNLASTTAVSFNGSANNSHGVTGTLPVGNGGTGATTAAGAAANLAVEVGKLLFPVGAIYASAVSTNPATLLGFGTWSAYGAGRVMVGKAATGTFATGGATGGEETHTLTIAEMPAHTHGIAAGVIGSSGSYEFFPGAGSNKTSTSTGGDGAHNNLQPYIVTYLWQRTA